MPNPDVTVFFRGSEKWRSPDPNPKILEPYEIVSDRDIEKLNKLVTCLYQIQQESKEKRERYFDNDGILKFMDELVLAIEDISTTKSTRNYMDMYGNLLIKVPVK